MLFENCFYLFEYLLHFSWDFDGGVVDDEDFSAFLYSC